MLVFLFTSSTAILATELILSPILCLVMNLQYFYRLPSQVRHTFSQTLEKYHQYTIFSSFCMNSKFSTSEQGFFFVKFHLSMTPSQFSYHDVPDTMYLETHNKSLDNYVLVHSFSLPTTHVVI